MKTLTQFFIAILSSIQFCDAYKICVMSPMSSKSHGILAEGYVRPLLAAGHEITYITPYPSKDPHPNLTLIDVSENNLIFSENTLSLTAVLNKEVDLNDFGYLLELVVALYDSTLSNKGVQKLLNDPEQHFDLVIVEWVFGEIYSGLSAVFNCPYIWFSTIEVHWKILALIDEKPNPAYTPDLQSLNQPPFTFIQRVEELINQQLSYAYVDHYYNNRQMEAYNKYFGPILAKKGRHLPLFEEVKYNASLVLGNSHVSLGQSISLPQNYIPIGGYHVDENVTPLPDDLKKIMDNAKHGVIYFSMGSNFRSKDLPINLKQGLLKVFSGLKQTVLWKFEEVLPGKPSNVHIIQWAPQPSILSHPNCRIFITHGGLLSTIETVHFGVPLIGIPIFADQFINVNRAVNKGYGKRVDLSNDMPDDLKVALEDMLSDPKYTNKVKELSLIYHDRPVAPAKEMVHWVEHVIKTSGAPHLRSPALQVSWYQKMYLDLIGLIVVVLYGVKIGIFYLLSLGKKTKNEKIKRN